MSPTVLRILTQVQRRLESIKSLLEKELGLFDRATVFVPGPAALELFGTFSAVNSRSYYLEYAQAQDCEQKHEEEAQKGLVHHFLF